MFKSKIGEEIFTSAVRISSERRSSGSDALQTGFFMVSETESMTFERTSLSRSHEGEPGFVSCRIPSNSKHCGQEYSLDNVLEHSLPLRLRITFRLTLPDGDSCNSIWISLKSRKSVPLFATRTSPLSSSAPSTSWVVS